MKFFSPKVSIFVNYVVLSTAILKEISSLPLGNFSSFLSPSTRISFLHSLENFMLMYILYFVFLLITFKYFSAKNYKLYLKNF